MNTQTNNIEDKIMNIISSALICDVNTLNINSGLGKHYQWDSLGHVSIMIALEKIYNIEINDDNIEQLLTVSNIIEYLNKNGY